MKTGLFIRRIWLWRLLQNQRKCLRSVFSTAYPEREHPHAPHHVKWKADFKIRTDVIRFELDNRKTVVGGKPAELFRRTSVIGGWKAIVSVCFMRKQFK